METRRLEDLKLLAGNSKMHSPYQIEKLSQSIKVLGFLDPVEILEDNTVINGHGRVAAAKVVGLEEVPVRVLSELPEDQALAYSTLDNVTTLLTGLNPDLMVDKIKDKELDPVLLVEAGYSTSDLTLLETHDALKGYSTVNEIEDPGLKDINNVKDYKVKFSARTDRQVLIANEFIRFLEDRYKEPPSIAMLRFIGELSKG